MQKSKRKGEQQNFLQYLLNEYLFFRREFSYVITAEPDVLIKHLRSLHYNNNTWWRRERRITPSIVSYKEGWSFELLAEQPGKNGNYSQSAKATGFILKDDDGVLLMEGEIVMGTWLQWIAMFVFIGFFIFFAWQISADSFSSTTGSFYPFIFVILFVVLWLQMYFDRNHLANIIKEAVDSANASYRY